MKVQVLLKCLMSLYLYYIIFQNKGNSTDRYVLKMKPTGDLEAQQLLPEAAEASTKDQDKAGKEHKQASRKCTSTRILLGTVLLVIGVACILLFGTVEDHKRVTPSKKCSGVMFV